FSAAQIESYLGLPPGSVGGGGSGGGGDKGGDGSSSKGFNFGQFNTGAGNIINGLSAPLRSMMQGTMMTAMNMWMGTMLAGMMGQSAMGLTQIQQLMNTAHMTPNQSEQLIGELGVGGVQANQVETLLGTLGSHLKSVFTPEPGTGTLTKQALLLEQYGLGPNINAETQGQQFQTIVDTFQKLQGQGRGGTAEQMLNMVGLSQLAPVMSNWGQISKEFQGFSLGLNSKQIKSGGGQAVTLQASIEKLQMTFMAFAVELAPLATKILQAINGMISALDKGKGLGGVWSAIGKNLGPVVQALVVAYAALKAAQLVKGGIDTYTTIKTGVGQIKKSFGGASSAAEVEAAGAEMAAAEEQAGGEIQAAGGTAAAEIEASGAEVAGAESTAGIGTVLGKVVGVLAPFMVFFSQFGKWLAGAFSILMDVLAPVGEVLIGALEGIAAVFGAPVEVVVAVVAALAAAVVLLTMHWNQVKTWVEQAANSIAQATVKLVGDLGQWVSKMAEAVEKFGSGVIEWVGKMVEGIAGFVSSIVSKIIQEAPTLASNALKLVEGFIVGLAQSISSLANQVVQAASNFVSSVWNAISQALSGIASQVAQKVSSIFSGIMNSPLVQGVENFGKDLSNAMGSIGKGVNNVLNGKPGKNGLKGVGDSTEEAVNNAIVRVFGDINPSQALDAIVKKLLASGVPDYIWGPIIQQESSGKNVAAMDTGGFMSVGPLQLYTGGGQGGHFSPDQLLNNPNLQAALGVPPIVEAYQQGVLKGLTGTNLLNYTASHSGHPDETGFLPQQYMKGLDSAYNQMMLTVNVNGNTSSQLSMAQMVAQEVINQLKLRTNFDVSQ
ncbi:MAG: hypothetical protein KGL39_35160, partial [Patescibacteria group bacterium]|nr:hypothetical protein [Patescibacteria group bacterium]